MNPPPAVGAEGILMRYLIYEVRSVLHKIKGEPLKAEVFRGFLIIFFNKGQTLFYHKNGPFPKA